MGSRRRTLYPITLEWPLPPLRKSIGGIRGEWERFILAGDPAHRKIEFPESTDKDRQDASAATREFAYIVKRCGFL